MYTDDRKTVSTNIDKHLWQMSSTLARELSSLKRCKVGINDVVEKALIELFKKKEFLDLIPEEERTFQQRGKHLLD